MRDGFNTETRRHGEDNARVVNADVFALIGESGWIYLLDQDWEGFVAFADLEEFVNQMASTSLKWPGRKEIDLADRPADLR